MRLIYLQTTSGQNIVGELIEEKDTHITLRSPLQIALGQSQNGEVHPFPVPPMPGLDKDAVVNILSSAIAMLSHSVPKPIEELYSMVVYNIMMADEKTMNKILLTEKGNG